MKYIDKRLNNSDKKAMSTKYRGRLYVLLPIEQPKGTALNARLL